MIQRRFHRRAPFGWALAISLASTGAALAGGFYVGLQRPDAASDPGLKGAVLMVSAGGCIQGGTTSVRVTAEGLVDGERRSIPVPVTRVSTAANSDLYAVRQKWPREGAWVLVIHGSARPTGGGEFHQYRLLAWEPAAWAKNSPVDLPARSLQQKPTPKEVDTMVRALDGKRTASLRARGAAR